MPNPVDRSAPAPHLRARPNGGTKLGQRPTTAGRPQCCAAGRMVLGNRPGKSVGHGAPRRCLVLTRANRCPRTWITSTCWRQTDRATVRAFHAVLAGEPFEQAMHHRIQWPDGSFHWLEINGSLQPDKAGRRRMIGVIREITHQREREHALGTPKNASPRCFTCARTWCC